MHYIERADMIASEESAERYLLKHGILRTYTECPHCGSSEISELRKKSLRCRECR